MSEASEEVRPLPEWLTKAFGDGELVDHDMMVLRKLYAIRNDPSELEVAPDDADSATISERRADIGLHHILKCVICGELATQCTLAKYETWTEARWLDLCARDFLRVAQVMQKLNRIGAAREPRRPLREA